MVDMLDYRLHNALMQAEERLASRGAAPGAERHPHSPATDAAGRASSAASGDRYASAR